MAMEIDGKKYSWTQPSCDTCFTGLFPKSENPHRLTEEFRNEERCCMCGIVTHNGLYIRVNPTTVPHPTPEADDDD